MLFQGRKGKEKEISKGYNIKIMIISIYCRKLQMFNLEKIKSQYILYLFYYNAFYYLYLFLFFFFIFVSKDMHNIRLLMGLKKLGNLQ